MEQWLLVFILCSLAMLSAMLVGALALVGSETGFAVQVETVEGQPAGMRWSVRVGATKV